MMHNPRHLYSEHTLGDLLDMLDQLHSDISEDNVQVSRSQDIEGLLRDVIYTAQETLVEIEKRRLRILRKPSVLPFPHT